MNQALVIALFAALLNHSFGLLFTRKTSTKRLNAKSSQITSKDFQSYHYVQINPAVRDLWESAVSKRYDKRYDFNEILSLSKRIQSSPGTLSDIEVIKVCWSLGVLGVRAIDLERHGLWTNLEELISVINFETVSTEAITWESSLQQSHNKSSLKSATVQQKTQNNASPSTQYTSSIARTGRTARIRYKPSTNPLLIPY